ncbi:uncharacterized protein LOC126716769 [Quercus robur]|uniref:uncharacterized protein LOC126716769 n=1 Tax=Quercus robur TaxID=38942 RepID=UPI002161C90D|nr:uncharacterized protein LOC126716769 [Quercus robur]
MGMYDIEIEGANVKVSIVDDPDLVDTKMDELRSSLLSKKKKIKKIFITNFRKAFLKNKKKTSKRKVVGLDIKFVKTDGNLNIGKFLLLCVGSHCLMIQLPDSEHISRTLGRFLSDETICFLGTGMSNIVSELGSFSFCTQRKKRRNFDVSIYHRVSVNTGVEVGFLAAKILKKPNVENYGLAELAGEVGMDIKEPIGECPDWNAKVFSQEEVKYAVHNAYTSYVIGNKLLDML